MNRLEVIQGIIDKKRAKIYLEIGVYDGRLFLKVRAGRKIAVDPKFIIKRKTKLKLSLMNFSNAFNKYYQLQATNSLRKSLELLESLA